MAAPALALAFATCVVACDSPGKPQGDALLGPALPSRTGSVVVNGCGLDSWQRATLATPAAKHVLSEVIMLCLVPREDGTVGPRDPSARAALTALTADLKRDGYVVNFGLTFADESGSRYDGAQTRAFLANPTWRAQLLATLPAVIAPADGVEIDLQQLPDDARPFVTALITSIAQQVRPSKHLNLFVPPSTTIPSNLPGGEAFSRKDLAPFVDRMRVMTLEYSDTAPGPTIDPTWAVAAVRLAKSEFPRVDIAYPLYGMGFALRGNRPSSYDEAHAIAADQNVPIERGDTGAPFIRYSAAGERRELWFDDLQSTRRALGSWNVDVLPADVGVLFYGLGSEDPELFDGLSARMP
jgi:spore germination protein YaaH